MTIIPSGKRDVDARPHRILILEDVADDAELVELELQKAGFAFTALRVDSEPSFLQALQDYDPDLILADYLLPQFDGLTALRLTRERFSFLPFILVTGSMNEETAVECMKAGADDYVIKEHLARLGPAVKGALKKTQERLARANAEEALSQAEKRYRNLFEQAVEGIYQISPDGRFLSANPALVRILGFESPQELIESISDVGQELYVDPHCHEKLLQMIREKGEVLQFDSAVYRQDGSIIDISENARAVYNESGELAWYQGTVEDKTEHKRFEAQLRQAQKMEAIGTLAGGIAHDFNNILTGILGFSELALFKLPKESRAQAHIKEVITAGNRAKNLVQQILAFSRQSHPVREPIQINLVITEAINLLRASLPTTIEIQCLLPDDSATVLADPTQIHQILMNLCTNAEFAMRHTGGILDISVRPVEITEPFSMTHGDLPPGLYVLLVVKDTGVGIAKDVLQRIFDPFFTTKQIGDGSGLGLAAVHGIVADHGGIITVQSELGHGTSFNVYLPSLPEQAIIAPNQQESIPRGTERILLVDDEECLARLEEEMLTQLGYHVTRKIRGQEALETFRQSPRSFDLLVTDQTMPRKTGELLARDILAIRPDLPIILCTGFSHVITKEKAKKLGIRAFIMKPLEFAELGRVVRQVLDEPTKSPDAGLSPQKNEAKEC